MPPCQHPEDIADRRFASQLNVGQASVTKRHFENVADSRLAMRRESLCFIRTALYQARCGCGCRAGRGEVRGVMTLSPGGPAAGKGADLV